MTPDESPEQDGKRESANRFDRAARDAEIVAARMRGLSTAQVARTYGISQRAVEKIMTDYRQSNPSLRHRDPVEIVDELLEGYQGAVEELALVSATTTYDAVRVGAINARMSALDKITGLLQSIGVLPNDLGQLRVEVDARFVADAVVRVLQQYDVPEEVEQAMIDALEGRRPDLLEAGSA